MNLGRIIIQKKVDTVQSLYKEIYWHFKLFFISKCLNAQLNILNLLKILGKNSLFEDIFTEYNFIQKTLRRNPIYECVTVGKKI
ncbi:hypothetical protein pb186bvf_016207 [Paramecium bursaria]